MGEEGDEEQLLAFLNVVLHRTGNDGVVSVKILDIRLSADIIGEKDSIMDVWAAINILDAELLPLNEVHANFATKRYKK